MNHIDTVLLRLLKHRAEYFQLKDIVPLAAVSEQTKALLNDFGKYFAAFPSHDTIDYATFVPQFMQWHSGLPKETYIAYGTIIRSACENEADEDQRNNILKNLSELELATTVANLVDEFQEGDVDDLYQALDRANDIYRQRRNIKAIAYIDTDIGELLQDEFSDAGIAWRLQCLNRSMRKLRGGDFGIIAGRPDKGKTTWLTSESTFMAPQLPEERNIIWLNNEGPGSRIIPRIYQSALGVTMREMRAMHEAGTLVDNYRAAVGRLDKFRVFDIHGYTTGQVDTIIDENNAGIVIFDMIDNIRGFGDSARNDLMLEKMYQWGRELMVKYDCIGFATSQISNDGDGELFPTIGMLKDSKTGKQGACDFQIMIGASNDPALQGLRGIGVVKNKLRRPDFPSDPRIEVAFDGINARYADIEQGS